MAEMPDYNFTNPSDKQAFQRFIVELMRNEINSYTRQTQNTYASQANYESVATSGVLPGIIVMYGGVTLPSGYLWCDGTQVLKGVYPALYAALGASRYAADTATQFYLPDLRSRLSRGRAVPTTDTLFATNNTNTHGHVANASGTNTSSTGAHNHSINGTTTQSPDDGGHSHTMTCGTPNNTNNRGATGTQAAVAAAGHTHSIGNTSYGVHAHNLVTGSVVAGQGTHNHSINAATITVTDNTTYVPAFVEVNYIIKT